MSAVAVAVAACAAVLVLDAAGAVAARRFGFAYQRLAPLSFAIYAATGYLAASAADHFVAGAAAAAAAGAVDATIGWRISDALGPRTDAVPARTEASIAAAVTLGAAAIGALAGLAA